MAGKVDWPAMMQEGKTLEAGRARVLEAWQIKERPAGEDYDATHSKTNAPTVYLDGSNPIKGRGVFSDIDLTANTKSTWDQMRATAQSTGFKTLEDEGFEDSYIFRIPALNAVIWRPRPGGDRVLAGDPEYVRYVQFSATNVESVDPSSNHPTFSMENVVAMANKGQVGFSKPVEEWGEGYARYENLIQMAKGTYLAMKQTGLDQQKPEQAKRLFELCKMKKSPAELGLFKPGDDEAAIQAGLQKEQQEIFKLFKECYQLSSQQMDGKMADLKERLDAHQRLHATREWHKDKDAKREEFKKLLEDAQDAHNRLAKLAIQLEAQSLSDDHKKILQALLAQNEPEGMPRGRRNSVFMKDYLALKSKLGAWEEELSSFIKEELIMHSPKGELPHPYTDWQSEFLAPIEMVNTPPPPSPRERRKLTAALAKEHPFAADADGKTRHRRSSQLVLTPIDDQPTLEEAQIAHSASREELTAS